MNKITTFAIESADKAEEERLDSFQLREIVKKIVFEAYLMGSKDANDTWVRQLADKQLYEINNPRL